MAPENAVSRTKFGRWPLCVVAACALLALAGGAFAQTPSGQPAPGTQPAPGAQPTPGAQPATPPEGQPSPGGENKGEAPAAPAETKPSVPDERLDVIFAPQYGHIFLD